jgi:hypothetical protein
VPYVKKAQLQLNLKPVGRLTKPFKGKNIDINVSAVSVWKKNA